MRFLECAAFCVFSRGYPSVLSGWRRPIRGSFWSVCAFVAAGKLRSSAHRLPLPVLRAASESRLERFLCVCVCAAPEGSLVASAQPRRDVLICRFVLPSPSERSATSARIVLHAGSGELLSFR